MPKKTTKTARRLRGEGTVSFSPKAHAWIGRLNAGIDPITGKRIRLCVTGKTQQEASQKLAEIRVKHSRGKTVEPSRITVTEWMSQFLTTYYEPFNKPNTIAKAKTTFNRLRKGDLGGMTISSLNQTNAQDSINKQADRYSAATLQADICLLSMAMAKLVALRRLEVNPMIGVRVPRKAKKAEEPRAMDPDVLQKFREEVEKSPYRAPILFCLNTGLRTGEMSALDIKDYKPTIEVSKSWCAATRSVQQSTKTASSTRSVPRPQALDPIMTEHMFGLKHKEPTAPLFQVIKPPYGRLTPTHFDDIVGKIADEIGEPWITPHSLRHTYCSTLFRQGIKINVVSKLLGHKDVATTYDIYVHMIPQEMDDAAEAVGKVMLG